MTLLDLPVRVTLSMTARWLSIIAQETPQLEGAKTVHLTTVVSAEAQKRVKAKWRLWPLCFGAFAGEGFAPCEERGTPCEYDPSFMTYPHMNCMHVGEDRIFTGMRDGSIIAWGILSGVKRSVHHYRRRADFSLTLICTALWTILE